MGQKVVVTDYTFPNVRHEQEAAKRAGADFFDYQFKTDAEIAEAVRGADVVAVQFAKFGPLSAASVKPGASIIRYGVGYDNIDLEAAKLHGLKVGYVPDYCADEVAEHSAAALVMMLRKFPQLDQSVRQGEWAAVKYAKPLKRFEETKIGFFGFGQIGRNVCSKLRGFGFEILVADPMLSVSDAEKYGVTKVSVEDLLAQSDAISLHAPATSETIGFFNRAHLSKMKSHAVIVNSARGALINELDLAEALHGRIIGGAALDVFEAEPLPETSPLRTAPNLVLTPHAAWYSESAIEKLQFLVGEDISRALAGQPPRISVPNYP